jgi:hypothetical protein
MSLDIQDKKYIRTELYTAIRASEKRTNHRTDLLIEKVRDDIKILGETMEARTRIIVREEVAHIVAPLYQYNDIMRQEFAALRGEFNAHVNNHAIHR